MVDAWLGGGIRPLVLSTAVWIFEAPPHDGATHERPESDYGAGEARRVWRRQRTYRDA
jgi:hypothetical protein